MPGCEKSGEDLVEHASVVPNDSNYSRLWGMGQIKAPQAWEVRSDASSVVVAVLDSGINYNHEDLSANMWVNPSQGSVSGFSNDRYGAKCVGGVKSGNPMDDNGHGTHCAGTIGAVGNNNKGVAGVAWKVKLMALKCMDSSGSCTHSDQIVLMNYAKEKGAKIISCSFGGYSYGDGSRYQVMSSLKSSGIIFACAAGNETRDCESIPHYPSSYDLDNIVAVAASSKADGLASFSNYGSTTVDIAAPGVDILSCKYDTTAGYISYDGTSMAAPHVAGALALVRAHYPSENYLQIIQRLYAGGDVVSAFSGKMSTGKRLNVLKAIAGGTLPSPIVSASKGTYFGKVRITWNAVSGASYYRVYRSTSATGTKTTLGTSWQTGTTFDDTTAVANTVYYYWAKAATSSTGANASDYGAYDTGFIPRPNTYPDAWDPNDDTPTATTNVLVFSTTAKTQGSHGLNASDRYDFYKANLTAGQTYVFESTGAADTYGELYKAANTNTSSRVAYNDDIAYPSNRNFRITYTPTSTGTYYLRVRQFYETQTGVYSLRYQQLVANDAWDPTDDTASGATVLTPSTTTKTHGTHTLSETDSYDWFKIQMTGGRTYTFETTSSNSSDTYGELYSSPSATAAAREAYDDDGGSGYHQFKIVYTPTTSGTYYLRVRKYTVGTDGEYSLKYGMSVPDTHDLVFCKSTSWSDFLFVANVTNAASGSVSFTTNDTIHVTYGFTDNCDNDILASFANTIQLVKYASAAATTYEVLGSVQSDFPNMRGGTWWTDRNVYISRPSPGYYGVRVELNMPQTISETNTANNVRIVRYQVAAPSPTQKSLVSVTVSGAASLEVQDGTTANYTATARFSDNSTLDVTRVATWSVSPSDKADISSSGELRPRQVTERTVVTVSAEYAYNGESKTGTKTVSLAPCNPVNPDPGACPFPDTVQYPITPMSIYAQVTIDGEPAQEGDVLAAFSAAGEVRGRVELGAGGRRAFNVYVTTPGEPITFKVWSHLDGVVYPCVTPLAGEIGGEKGSPSEPYMIDFGNDPFGTPVQYPNPPMTIVARVVIKGEPAERGDRVGVFCGSELRAKGAVRVEDGIAKITLAPSVSANGETLTFKVWDASEEELLNASGSIRATIGGEVGSPSARYLIEVSDTVTQSIAFNGSTWQFVSVNVAPEDASPRAVFQNVIGDIDRITCGDKVFKPSWSDADNTLGSIVAGAGYWVKRSTSGSVTASITGLPADVSTTRISLVSGWNSVGYVPQMAGSIRSVLADALASGVINRVVAGDQVFYPSWSDSDNTLSTMQPGVGYWIKATGPVTFAFNEPSGTSAASVLGEISGGGDTHPFGELRDRDPVSGCMLKAKLNLFGELAAYGDATVAAYAVVGGVTSEIPCGVAAVNLEGNVIMNVQKYLPFSMVFKVWDALSGRVYDADTVISFAAGEDEKMNETIVVNGSTPIYKVIFELSGVGAGSGVRTGGGALTQLVARASAAIAPEVVGNPGYEFLLWDTDFSYIKCDTTVHAVYQIDDPTPVSTTRVYFDANGGQGAGTSVVATKGQVMPDAGEAPTRTGYVFRGYYDAAGSCYYDEEMESAQIWNKDDETATLYAQWTAIPYSITYANVRGAANANPTTYTIEDQLTFSPLPDVAGYTFRGWDLAGIALGSTGDKTVTALWDEIPGPTPDVLVITNVVPAAGGVVSANFSAAGAGAYKFNGGDHPAWINSPVITIGSNRITAWSLTITVSANAAINLEMDIAANESSTVREWTYVVTGPDNADFAKIVIVQDSNAPSGFAFEATETWAEKDGAFVLTVYGGSDEAETSVKVTATYGSAKAADLVLKEATVEGESGVEQTNLKFPLTLNWAKGDTTPKTITIPTAKGKSTDAPKSLVWNLSAVKGRLDVTGVAYCIGMIEPGADWTGKDVYVLPYVADSTGGKVSGGASVKPDTKGNYKTVTLKATANKGYWFAGWYDAYGDWMSGDLSYKVTLDGSDPLPGYEARFVPEQPSLCGTYNGYAKVNLKGMTLVKNADTSADVYGEYAFTVTLAKTGKVSGSVTVGGKKITLKGDAVYEADDGYVSVLVTADEKACFGKANGETLSLYLDSDGMAGLSGYVETDDAFKPLGGDECWGEAWKDVSKDKDEAKKLEVFAGMYAGAALQADGGVIPVSIVVDKTGKVTLAGKYSDGTALTASGAMGGYMVLDDGTETAELELVMTPKALGSGAYHLSVFASTDDTGVPSLFLNGYTTTYTEKAVKAVADAYSLAYAFTDGCWIPEDADPDFGVVRLYSGEDIEDIIDILYTSQNGKITGLGKATATGYTVKFDKKTGLFTVTKGKEYTIQGVLGAYDCSCQAVGRINKDGTFELVGLEFTTLPEPQENFPWIDDGFVLTLGQNFNEAMQPTVLSDGWPLELTISGLPAGLKFDKKTGCITGAPTKDGSFAVKVSYAYGTQKITRTTTLVVAPKPEGLPVGTYAGYATVNVGVEEGKPVACPFTATIDTKGALSGSITLFGKKATLKASGYVDFYDDAATYVATLDLKAVDKKWGAVTLQLVVGADCVISSYSEEVFGDGFAVDSVCAWRNQSKDDDYAARVKPYVGNYVTALSTEIGDGGPSGVTTLSVSVDKKGNVKIAGMFVDGSAFSASAPLAVVDDEDGTSAQACVAVMLKSLGQGAMCVELDFSAPTGAEVAGLWCFAEAAKYVRTSGEYVEYGISTDFAYRYASLAWVDASVSAVGTCLSVSCENGSFDEATFTWKMKADPLCGLKIVGIDKRISGPTMTFKLDDKTGLFSGTCGTYKIFGAMQEGTCSGVGTVVGRDGSIGRVTVGVADR